MLLICDCPVAALGWGKLLGREIHGVSEKELDDMDTVEDGLIVRLRHAGLRGDIGVPQSKLEDLLKKTSGRLLLLLEGDAQDWPLLIRMKGYGIKHLCFLTADVEELRAATESMLNGGEMSSRLLEAVSRLATHRRTVSDLGNERPLTSRETDVVMLVAVGLTNKQIAVELNISYETVKEHVQHILRKLNCTDRTVAATKVAASIFPKSGRKAA